MINERVDIDIPNVEMIKVGDFAEQWEKITDRLFLCWSNVSGFTNATVITTFKIKEIVQIVAQIVGEKPKVSYAKVKSFTDFSELYQSALSEVAHILASHFTNALSNLFNEKLMIDPPDVNVDNGRQLIKILRDDLGLIKELSLVITTQIIIKEKKIQGSFLFIPDPDKLKNFLDTLSAFSN